VKLLKVILVIYLSFTLYYVQAQDYLGAQTKNAGPTVFSGQTLPVASNFAYIAGSVTACETTFAAGVQNCVYALHHNPTAGNLLICSVVWYQVAENATLSLTSTNNGTWKRAGNVAGPLTGSGSAGWAQQSFYVPVAVAGADTVTATASVGGGQSTIGWECAEFSYSGVVGLDGPVVWNNTNAVAGSTSIAFTTTNASDLVFGACLVVDTSCSVGAGYTSINDTAYCSLWNGTTCTGGTTGNSFNGSTGGLLQYKVGVAAGSQTMAFGMGATDSNIIMATVF
jgi:hypothetical protein